MSLPSHLSSWHTRLYLVVLPRFAWVHLPARIARSSPSETPADSSPVPPSIFHHPSVAVHAHTFRRFFYVSTAVFLPFFFSFTRPRSPTSTSPHQQTNVGEAQLAEEKMVCFVPRVRWSTGWVIQSRGGGWGICRTGRRDGHVYANITQRPGISTRTCLSFFLHRERGFLGRVREGEREIDRGLGWRRGFTWSWNAWLEKRGRIGGFGDWCLGI
ncbi:hypothetical protein BDU57DRAFT_209948 [Ampelomyces quisqualis]|uniref:Uncharacterized protein n=1 Tax=Ampelomyces quisqualis TaxID=50730 RepID=A0A6A5QPC6_AMPQU|nr:hypothetical protein BDU57DRAFT_209948 [Ampelomyces quisqualis]